MAFLVDEPQPPVRGRIKSNQERESAREENQLAILVLTYLLLIGGFPLASGCLAANLKQYYLHPL